MCVCVCVCIYIYNIYDIINIHKYKISHKKLLHAIMEAKISQG